MEGHPSKEMKSLNICDDCDSKNEIKDLTCKAHEENVDNDNEQDKLQNIQAEKLDDDGREVKLESGNMDVGKNVEFVAQEEKSENENLHRDSGDKLDMGKVLESETQDLKSDNDGEQTEMGKTIEARGEFESKVKVDNNQTSEEFLGEEKDREPVLNGTEIPGRKDSTSASAHSLDADLENQGVVEKAVALTNFVKEKGVVAVSSVLRRLSGKRDDNEKDVCDDENKDSSDFNNDIEFEESSRKSVDRSSWNPLNYVKISRDADEGDKLNQTEENAKEPAEQVLKGRIILYTRLGCQECKEARSFFYQKRLRYVEINIDVFPGRRLELEKISGSSAVPKVFFNEILIGGLNELKSLDESGKLSEKIEYLVNEVPSIEAPLPPLSGEDDLSGSGAVDELALVVRKMKESIIIKDRFYKMRRFTNCFLGSEAVDFLSEDQYLEREEAVEFGRKLASKLFFQNVLEENLFEDGNQMYRFLDDDPIVSSQCHNIARGIIDVKTKPIIEIASRLRFLSFAIFEAYTSNDGKHVDYRSIHGSEEFARYLRIVEELQRVELQEMPREEKLAFIINLYNMMAIHAILVCGHPAGALERRKLFEDFKYVVGGLTYSLSAIQNGILRGNQRPPYNLMKPFGAKDKRSRVALPYVEPLVHFALVFGTRSGPALRCYSPGNIDKELMEAASSFLRSGGLLVDFNTGIASASKILKWFSVDFGKNEIEVLKHASNYLEPSDSQALLEVLAISQLKVIYQPYDWGLNS